MIYATYDIELGVMNKVADVSKYTLPNNMYNVLH